jgi:hypothetical protein
MPPVNPRCMPPIVQRYLIALVLAALLTLMGSHAHIAELTARAKEIAVLVTQPSNAGQPMRLAVVQTSVDTVVLEVARWLWYVWVNYGLRTSKALVNEYGKWERYIKVLKYIYTTMLATVVYTPKIVHNNLKSVVSNIPEVPDQPLVLLQSNLNVMKKLREDVEKHYKAVMMNLHTNVSAYTRRQLACNLKQTNQFRGELNTMHAELSRTLTVSKDLVQDTVMVPELPDHMKDFVQGLRIEYAPLYKLVASIQS